MVMIAIVLIIYTTTKSVKDGCDLARAFLMNEISAVTGSMELTDKCGFTCGRTRDYLESRLIADNNSKTHTPCSKTIITSSSGDHNFHQTNHPRARTN
jgi:hypothetical protein